jgi:hypothetical protein
VDKGPFVNTRLFFQPDAGLTDRNLFTGYNWNYGNTSQLSLFGGYNYIFLFNDFDPSRTNAVPLPGNQGYGTYRAALSTAATGAKN